MAQSATAQEIEVVRLRTLYHLLAALTRAKTLEEVYEAAFECLLTATEADRAAILFFDDDGVMRFHASRGLSLEYQQRTTGHTPWARGTKVAQPISILDTALAASLVEYRDCLAAERIRALTFIPLLKEGGVFGKLMLYYTEPHECAGDEIEIAQAIGNHVALATEHKRAELELASSQQLFQGILDNSANVIFLKDLHGRYLLINRRFEELFQVPQTAVAGRTDYDLFAADIAERLRENDRSVMARQEALTIEECVTQRDGIHTYLSSKFLIRDAAGNVAGVCGIATDITDRKQLEAGCLHLAAIVENSNDAIISNDLDGIITSWNKGAERIFGYTADEAVGRPITMLALAERPMEMPEILEQLRQGERVHVETRRRRKDGETVHVSLTVSPIRDSTGRISGASKIARDITDRKRAEAEREQLLARERETSKTAKLLNTVGPMLAGELNRDKLTQVVTDIATVLVGAEFGAFFHNVVNPSGESYMLYTLSGISRESFAGFPMPRNTEVFGPTFRGEGVIRSGDITQDPRYGKNAPYHGMPQGHLPVRSYLAAPVIAASGEVLGGLFFGHSETGKFTELHESVVKGIAAQAAIAMDNARLFEQAQRAQNELKRSNEELRRANQDLETFAYSASHDLREPLHTIAMSGQLLKKVCGEQLPANAPVFLTRILRGAEQMETLLDDLLAYATATKHAEGPPPSVDPGKVLAGVVESLRGPIEEARATVLWESMPAMCVHESRLAQLLQNLISNALKYRNPEAPRVHISAIERDGWSVVSVADNGIGIDPQYALQIFELFKRLHRRDKYPGSGIGLAICQRILEQYGGRIWLDRSVPGSGSTFCFAIPAGPR